MILRPKLAIGRHIGAPYRKVAYLHKMFDLNGAVQEISAHRMNTLPKSNISIK